MIPMIPRARAWRLIHIVIKGVFLLAMAVVAAIYLGIGAFFAGSWIRYQLDTDERLSERDLDVLESRLEERLSAGDYGIVSHAIWSDLFAQSFYVYGRANRYERSPTEEKRKILVRELARVYRNIVTEQRGRMAGAGATRLEGGIIYQWHRLHVLALLAKYSRSETLADKLLRETDGLAAYLRQAPRHTEESYRGWAWWVDNADAYAALAIADEIVGDGRYASLARAWTDDMRASLDDTGNLLAEAYGPLPEDNQSRSPASAWIIAYASAFDPAFARDQLRAFDASFPSEFLGMPTLREVPAGQDLTNGVLTGPVVFGQSSAGTLLGLAAYEAMGESDRAKALERTARAAFLYDRDTGSICFGVSTLLESTLYWAESFRRQ